MITNDTAKYTRRDQIAQKLTKIGHRMSFNNERIQCHIFRPRNDKCKTIQTIKNQWLNKYKITNEEHTCKTATNNIH